MRRVRPIDTTGSERSGSGIANTGEAEDISTGWSSILADCIVVGKVLSTLTKVGEGPIPPKTKLFKQRSSFIAQAAEKELMRRRQLQAPEPTCALEREGPPRTETGCRQIRPQAAP